MPPTSSQPFSPVPTSPGFRWNPVTWIAALVAAVGFTAGCASAPSAAKPTAAAPMPVKVVVVSLFEIGEDTGDRPGEFQLWVERERLTNKVAIPGTHRPLRYRDDGVLAVCTGGGIARSAAVIAALGRDPRFDFSKAYWITAGIAGIAFALHAVSLRLPNGSLPDPVPTAVGVVVCAVFTGLFLFQVLLWRFRDLPFGKRLHVHALNGFYVATYANRALSRLWPRSQVP